MSTAGPVAVDAGRYGGFAAELQMRLDESGRESRLFPRDAGLAEKQALLRSADLLVSIYPDGADALLVIGLAVGAGQPVLILAADAAAGSWPPEVHSFATLQQLVDAIPVGPEGRLVDLPLVDRQRLGPDYRAWHGRRYPAGIRSTDWTLDEQLAALADGGGRLLKGAFDARLFPLHPMPGANLAGADLAGLRLNRAILGGARLAQGKLAGADLVDPDLRGADLSGADLAGASLLRAELTDALAADAVFDRAIVDRAVLHRLAAPRLSARSIRMVESNLAEASLAGAALGGASFRAVDFSGVDLSGADATGAQFRRCRFTGASLEGAVFDRAVLIDCLVDGLRDGETALAAAHVVHLTNHAGTSGQPRSPG